MTQKTQKSSLTPVAKIINVHGVKGLIKIKSFLESLEDFLNLEDHCWEDGTPLKITPHFMAKDLRVAEITGVTDRTEAEKLKKKTIYTTTQFKADTDKDEFLYSDLMGYKVYVNQQEKGKVVRVYNYGASDVLVIESQPEGAAPLQIDIPFLKHYVPHVNAEQKSLEVDPEAFESFLKLNNKL